MALMVLGNLKKLQLCLLCPVLPFGSIIVQHSHTRLPLNIKQQTRKKFALSDFRLDVVRALLEEFGIQKLDVRGRPSIETPVRITAQHFPSKVQSSEDGRRRCFVCSHTTRGPKRETKTSYECKECNVGLCAVPCFEAYHTLKHF